MTDRELQMIIRQVIEAKTVTSATVPSNEGKKNIGETVSIFLDKRVGNILHYGRCFDTESIRR